jgi:hypothetical protein
MYCFDCWLRLPFAGAGTDDVRNRQFWYLNAEGQLTSAFIKGIYSMQSFF